MKKCYDVGRSLNVIPRLMIYANIIILEYVIYWPGWTPFLLER